MKKILLIFLVTMVTYSCTTTDEDPTPLTGESDVTSIDNDAAARARHGCNLAKVLSGNYRKSWQVVKYLINDEDYTSLFMPCALDNIQNFYTDGRYIEVEGATKCDASDPDIFDEGTYEFSDDYSLFILSASHLQVSFTIVELTESRFKIKYPDPDFGIVEIWLVAKKKHH